MENTVSGLERLFNPGSIAVIGASADLTKIRGRIMRALTDCATAARIYPISRSTDEILGLKTFASLAEVPEAVDLAIIVIGADKVIEALEDCAARGVGGALVFASGFAEGGNAHAEHRMAEIAAQSGMRILGPNTLGFYSDANGVAASFSPIITEWIRARGPAYRPCTEGVDIVCQSGGLGFALHVRALLERIPVRHVVTTGNEADLGAIEVADYLLSTGGSRGILMFVEGFKNVDALESLAEKAAAQGVPIIINKIGKSDAGQRAAISHTAHLTGSDAIYDAVFRRLGMIRVSTPEEMLAAAAALAKLPPARGRRVAVVTTSGGTGGWAADIVSGEGLEVPEPSPALRKRLDAIIPGYGSSANPIDVTAAVVEDGGAGLGAVLQEVEASGEFDAALVIVSFSAPGRVKGMRAVLAPLLAARRIPILFHSAGLPHPENLEALDEIGGLYQTLGAAGRGLRALAGYGAFLAAREQGRGPLVPAATVDPGAPPADLLKAYAIPTPPVGLATSADAAAALAEEMGFPVVLKIESPDIAHKTEAGGVFLNVADPEAARRGYATILANVAQAAPGARIDGVQVQKMAPAGIEMVVGMTRDADFGPVVMLGFGGVYVEILRDSAVLPLPVGRDEALGMIHSLKGIEILQGARGRPPVDLEALAGIVAGVSALVTQTGDRFAEIDLNPVILYPEGQGAMVVDTLFVDSNAGVR
ncbi:CoA-binding protein [Pararhodobacter marinus]|uniref:CoA-binding protein n=1 Tax=Pararhodobacter marinus TaxID=2184063 RepID=A0A2U2CHY1_9RHOB|nr:CoA-binding protein [Pararhodobacter marinus]